MDRRYLLVIVLCGLFLLGGCAEADFTPDPGVETTPTPDADGHEPTETRDDHDDATDVEGTLEVHSINVGQADATLLRTDEETMLIDSGDWRDDGETVIAYLEAHDVERIDHLVSTHAHADHIGGHEAVIDHYETEKGGIGAIYDSGVVHTSKTYERYLDAVERHEVDLFQVADGDALEFGGADVEFLNPEEPGGDDLHYNAVAVHVAYGETSFLLTGDAEHDAESRMVDARGDDLDADVYQAGHHGSRTSSSDAFLDVVDPAVAVISAAYDSQYGHPHDEALERFADRDVAATWTAVHGTVVFVSDGEEVSVRTQHDASTAPLELKDQPKATADPVSSAEERFVVRSDGEDGGDGGDAGDEGGDRLAPAASGTGQNGVVVP